MPSRYCIDHNCDNDSRDDIDGLAGSSAADEATERRLEGYMTAVVDGGIGQIVPTAGNTIALANQDDALDSAINVEGEHLWISALWTPNTQSVFVSIRIMPGIKACFKLRTQTRCRQSIIGRR